MEVTGFTAHGHAIEGVPQTGRPRSVARCGGPALCKQCGPEASRARARFRRDEHEAEAEHIVDVQVLYATTDATVWAHELATVIAAKPDAATDEGFLTGWIANAMVTAEDHLRRRQREEAEKGWGERPAIGEPELPGFVLEPHHSVPEAVFMALGAASTCWDDLSGTGVFHSEAAKEIGEKLLAHLYAWVGSAQKVGPDDVLILRASSPTIDALDRWLNDLTVAHNIDPEVLADALATLATTDRGEA